MDTLKAQVIRLASQNRNLRPHLLNILKQAGKRFDLSPYQRADISAKEVVSLILNQSSITTRGPDGEEPLTSEHNKSINEDVAGINSTQASIVNRARAWPLEKFISWMESFTYAYQLDNLRKIVNSDQVLIFVKDKRGKIVLQQVLDPSKVTEWQEMTTSPDYSFLQGKTIEVQPLDKNPLYKLLKKLEQTQELRHKDYAQLYSSLREIHAVTKLHTNTSKEIVVQVVDQNVVMGGMQSTKIGHTSQKDVVNRNCDEDLSKLSSQYGEGDVWMVWHAVLHPYIKGKHFGVKMYQTLIDEIKSKGTPVYLVANRCYPYAGGDLTSDDAKKVWQSLARQYPSSGTTIVIV